MKLRAWRDDLDIADAARLLAEIKTDKKAAWAQVEPYLQPGKELKARFALMIYGKPGNESSTTDCPRRDVW